MQNDAQRVVVLGYGSLLHVKSLRRTVEHITLENIRPVLVYGYQRIFNLVMRSLVNQKENIAAQHVAALNVRVKNGAQMGGVAFPVNPEDLELLNKREYCYRRIQGVKALDFNTLDPLEDVSIYSVYSDRDLKKYLPSLYLETERIFGLKGMQHHSILPADDYLSLCLQGAFAWGNAFGQHFIDHTYLADGQTPLKEYLSLEEVERRLNIDLEEYIQTR